MAIYDYLPTYHQVENNNLKGLQPGFVVAQMDVKAESTIVTTAANGAKLLENGHICGISADGIDAWANGQVMFLHYSEPLNTILNSDKYFAVNLEEECPRLVQLIPGDEWMCTMDYETAYADTWAEMSKHIVKVTKDTGWYSVSAMADGTKAYHYIYLG
jgi:hypothetical protein